MKFAVLLSSADAFFSPMKQFTDTDDLTQTSFFTDLIEAFQNTADDDYYYDYEDEGDDYESPATSVFKQVAASLLDFNPALRSAAKGKDEQSGCSIEQMSKKNALATLNCPNVKNGHVKEGTPCSWQCNNGYVYGNKGTNRLKCESGGAWNGIKKVKCNAGCTWPALRRLQANGEFAHCQDETQFGLARFKCRVERGDRDSFDYRGARCVCKDSRRNRNAVLSHFFLFFWCT